MATAESPKWASTQSCSGGVRLIWSAPLCKPRFGANPRHQADVGRHYILEPGATGVVVGLGALRHLIVAMIRGRALSVRSASRA